MRLNRFAADTVVQVKLSVSASNTYDYSFFELSLNFELDAMLTACTFCCRELRLVAFQLHHSNANRR